MAYLLKIKDIAKEKNIAMKDLAERAGLTPQTLSRLMRTGTTNTETLERIADILGVSASVFFESPTTGGGDSAGRDVNKGNAKVLNIEQLNADQLAEVARLMRDREGGEGDQGVTEQGAALRADANPSNNTPAQLRQEIAQLRQDNDRLRQDNDQLTADLAKARDKIDQLNDQLNKAHTELLQFYRKG